MKTTIYLREIPAPPTQARRDYARRLRDEAHGLLARALEQESGIPAPAAFAHGPHGKPYWPDSGVCFNLTHCRGLAACAVGDAECGVDAEPFEREPGAAMRRVCAPDELRFLAQSTRPAFDFFRLWTLKESFVKATGMGLSFPLREAVFTPVPQGLLFCRDGFFFRQLICRAHLVSLCVVQTDFPARPIVPEPAATAPHVMM